MAKSGEAKGSNPESNCYILCCILITLILLSYVLGEICYDFSFGVGQLFLEGALVEKRTKAITVIEGSCEWDFLLLLGRLWVC